MAQLLCMKVEEGLRPAEATVTIQEYDGRSQYLPVDRELLTRQGQSYYLPVRILRVNGARKLALIALPIEADSGANETVVRRPGVVPGSPSRATRRREERDGSLTSVVSRGLHPWLLTVAPPGLPEIPDSSLQTQEPLSRLANRQEQTRGAFLRFSRPRPAALRVRP